MRSMYGPGQLLLASKKTRIQNLIKQCDVLSVEEIKKLPEKPDVIRGLLEIKEFGNSKGTGAELIASVMQKSHKEQIEDAAMIYQYHGEPFWLKIKSTELQIQANWYWSLISSNEIYISSNKIKISSSDLNYLKQNSKEIKSGYINDIRLLEKDRVSKLL